MAMSARTEVLTRSQWSTAVLAAALILGTVLGYVVAHRSTMHTESVRCLSAEGAITCTLDNGWDVAVPLSVAWTDSTGSYREDGRPECLPPTGRGLEGPVQVTWTDVKAGGFGWRQVVWVGC